MEAGCISPCRDRLMAAGRLAVQIAKHLEAKKVIATACDAETLKSVVALGADVLIPVVEDRVALKTLSKSNLRPV